MEENPTDDFWAAKWLRRRMARISNSWWEGLGLVRWYLKLFTWDCDAAPRIFYLNVFLQMRIRVMGAGERWLIILPPWISWISFSKYSICICVYRADGSLAFEVEGTRTSFIGCNSTQVNYFNTVTGWGRSSQHRIPNSRTHCFVFFLTGTVVLRSSIHQCSSNNPPHRERLH